MREELQASGPDILHFLPRPSKGNTMELNSHHASIMLLLLGFVEEPTSRMPTFSLTKATIWNMQKFAKVP